ncbi:MAG: IgGFc-binding protein [Paludibacteraceae bacterium]|nr:IgGFc-binding protein [Paludibacteraceae bacterium]
MLLGALMMPQMAQADEIASGQSTEGSDFWVTFLQGDESNNNPREFELTLSARENCHVTISKPKSNYRKEIDIDVNDAKKGLTSVMLFSVPSGKDPKNRNPLSGEAYDTAVCYSFNSEVVDTSAVHITVADGKKISLFASNWKTKSFDATNVLPTNTLKDEYYIQAYPPSAHGGDPQQGTHFAIVATEDNTVVDYCPTVKTIGITNLQQLYNQYSALTPEIREQFGYEITPEMEQAHNWKPGDTITTAVLDSGQVWYVWTGQGGGDDYDLSGTYVKARNGKRIAVFQGAPHTNIPYQIRDRDHIFSQAMPTVYWGNTFAVTASMSRGRDKIRIMALYDETEVRVNGQLVHTFHFEDNAATPRNDNVPSGAKVVQCVPRDKRTFEFELGDKGTKCTDSDNKFDLADPLVEGTSCYIETSCPTAVHLFMVSNRYDNTDKADPAMVWINPIEQVIDTITFATYKESNTHYVNVVTTKDNINDMTLDDIPITGFNPVVGSNDKYYFVRMNIPHNPHTLKGKKGFIAHVYGYGTKESYGYSAGGATKPLNATITINGDTLVEGETTQICRYDLHSNTIPFTCRPDYEYKEIIWNFGDGTPIVYGHADEIHGKTERTTGDSIVAVSHDYEKDSIYQAYVVIVREASTVCKGRSLRDSFPMEVVLDKLKITYKELKDHICSDAGTGTFRIYYTSSHKFDDSNSKIEYNDIAKNDGFTTPVNREDPSGTYFEVSVPSTSKSGRSYEIVIALQSKCGNDTSTIPFTVNYPAAAILDKRWTNTIAVWSAKDMKDHIVTNNPDDHSLDGVNYFDGYEWFKLDSTDMYNTKHYSKMIDEQSSFIVKEHVPVSGEYYVDIHYTDANGEKKVISSCPIAFGDQQYDAFASDATISNVGNIIIKHAPDHKMLVMSAKDGEATWLNAEGNTLKTFEVNAGGSLIPYPSTDAHGLYILRVEAGKDEKSIKVFIQ